jgi:flavin reductase (DIM6/NTAB) family NADH-FMN oxidoreductase RutF
VSLTATPPELAQHFAILRPNNCDMDSKELRRLFERIDREVWIVTAAHAGRRGGLVATFVAPASIVRELPRIIAGIAKTHETWKLIEASGAFAAHLVEESQAELVWHFGLQSSRDVDKFAGLEVGTVATGSPILRDALAWLDCQVETRMDTGDRTVYLGEVCAGESRSEARPLTIQTLLATASPENKRTLNEQMTADAARDAEAIARWRAQR